MGQSPYTALPPERFWRSGVALADPLALDQIYVPKLRLTPADPVATAGSCFARHLTRALRERGYHLLDVEPAPEGLTPAEQAAQGYGQYSARFGAIYTARQLLELAQEVLSPSPPLIWTREGRFFDAKRPGVPEGGFESADAVAGARAAHLDAVRGLFTEMELFVFTLGLTEAWQDRQTGVTLPSAPGVIAGDMGETQCDFVNFTYPEVLDDLLAFMDLVTDLRGGRGFRMLLSVSPVPLTATASAAHVLAASTYSKAVLRAVAGDLAAMDARVDYVPAFEIVTNPAARGTFFAPNLREVTTAGAARVMDVFFDAMEGGSGAAEDLEGEDEAACEEALLEAFGFSEAERKAS